MPPTDQRAHREIAITSLPLDPEICGPKRTSGEYITHNLVVGDGERAERTSDIDEGPKPALITSSPALASPTNTPASGTPKASSPVAAAPSTSAPMSVIFLAILHQWRPIGPVDLRERWARRACMPTWRRAGADARFRLRTRLGTAVKRSVGTASVGTYPAPSSSSAARPTTGRDRSRSCGL